MPALNRPGRQELRVMELHNEVLRLRALRNKLSGRLLQAKLNDVSFSNSSVASKVPISSQIEGCRTPPMEEISYDYDYDYDYDCHTPAEVPISQEQCMTRDRSSSLDDIEADKSIQCLKPSFSDLQRIARVLELERKGLQLEKLELSQTDRAQLLFADIGLRQQNRQLTRALSFDGAF
jgi:hypothetical protein